MLCVWIVFACSHAPCLQQLGVEPAKSEVKITEHKKVNYQARVGIKSYVFCTIGNKSDHLKIYKDINKIMFFMNYGCFLALFPRIMILKWQLKKKKWIALKLSIRQLCWNAVLAQLCRQTGAGSNTLRSLKMSTDKSQTCTWRKERTRWILKFLSLKKR